RVHQLAGDSYSPLGITKAPTSTANLIQILDDDIDRRVSNDLNLKGYATFSFLEDFKFTTNMSYDRFSEVRTRYGNSETGPYQGIGGFGNTYQNEAIINAQQLLKYYKQIGKNNVTGLAGHEYYQNDIDILNYKSAYGLVNSFPACANFVGRSAGGT